MIVFLLENDILMKFDEFLKYVPKITNEFVSPTMAHEKMAPIERLTELRSIDWSKIKVRNAAVMMLIYPKNSLTHLLLIIRATYPGVHSSQIAFPGGKTEISDKDLLDTALRETEEEIGISKNHIEIVRPFTNLYIPPSNFLVSPFLGISHHELEFTLQEEEVAGIIELPFSEFMDDANVVTRRLTTSYAKDIDVPAFLVKEHVVWGATAMMMSELKETLKLVIDRM
jgi:8-oxo-dGTP pyrophosphatase MutT (NUDIX family)